MSDGVLEVELAASAAPLVAALGTLAEAEEPFVLVGGLAVMSRLRQTHRATTDVDALHAIDDFAGVCVRSGIGSVVDGALVVDGVRIDAIEIDDAVDFAEIALLAEPLGRLFTAGHRFAYGDADQVRLRASDQAVEIGVASARSLLICKLHAYLSPRRDPNKRGSDALDVVRLAEVVVRDDDLPLRRGVVPNVVADVAVTALTAVREDLAALTRRLRTVGVDRPSSELFELLLEDVGGRPPDK